MSGLQRVLYVEDEPDIQAVARLALELVGGFTVKVCSSGEEALREVQAFAPQMILLDVMMPVMDGPTTLKALRELPAARAIPVAFMTAKVQPQEVARYTELGALGVIAKPFDPMTLADAVRRLWEAPVSEGHPTPADLARLQLQQLQAEFAGQLPDRLVAIRSGLERLRHGDGDPTEVQTLHRLVHSLTGSGGIFGMPELSVAARELESQLATSIRSGASAAAADWQTLEERYQRLADAAGQGPQVQGPQVLGPQATTGAHAAAAQVHLVVDDPGHRDVLLRALRDSGYRIVQHDDLASLRCSFVSVRPGPSDAVVLDVVFADNDPGGGGLLSDLHLGRHGRTPVVTGVVGDALAARLAASRAGASHTLRHPMDPARLVEVLDLLTGRQPETPYRVLLVDDDALLLAAQAGVLRAAGMEVRSLCDPLQTLAELESFSPDVLLLDVYMPQASGPELAAALRECDDHVHLPILFLSAETDLTQQLLALNLGGDDFLVKPVQPQHLVAAVTARARRARQNSALRRRLQTTLYEREREHLALGQHASVSIADRAGNILDANERFCQNSGYSLTELQGQNHRLLKSGVHPPAFYQGIWSTISSGQAWHGELCSRRKNGEFYWVESTITPFVDREGRVYQYVSIQTDISHIKAVEAALRAQRDMQRVISVAAARLMATPGSETSNAIDAALRDSGAQLGADRAYLFRFSKDGTSMTNTHAWHAEGVAPMADHLANMPTEITPWMKEQFLQQGHVVVQDVEQLPPQAQADQRELRARGLRSVAIFPLLKDDRPLGFIGYSVLREGNRSPRREWTSEALALLKVLADVMASAVARNLAESRLRKSEARLNFLVSSSPVAIYTRESGPPWALSYVSPNIEQLVGVDACAFTADAGLGLSLVHAEDVDRVARELPAVLERGIDLCEYRLRCADGRYRWVQDQRRLVRDSDGAPQEIIGCWMDITERKQFETELAAFNLELERRVEAKTRDVLDSERLAQATLDALSARVVILNEHGDIVATNRTWCHFYGGRTPESVGNYLRYCEHKDRTSGRDAATHLAPRLRAVLSGVERSQRQEYSEKLNGQLHWFFCRIERFGTEEAPRVVVSHEDITALKQAERAQLRSQRLESLGTLAGGVAHDLNNALAPVLMGMSLLKEQYPGESKLFNMIESSAQRGTHMVRQLLTFARGAEGERVAVCPTHVVRELERLMSGSFPKNIQLQIDLREEQTAVVGDPTQLHQVLLNLCVNARDAMPGGGTLSVRVQVVALDATYARSIPDAEPGRYVALEVGDTGSGMPPEVLDRIFDPFFTTKGADKGTGLGLSTVLGIVKGHGGFVQVYSQLGEGSVFTVYLPAAPPPSGDAALSPAAAGAEAEQGHGETILFVDDEAAVREVGRTVLERLSYAPLVATDGADGLVQAADHRKTLSAVITDLHMPHMDGLAFVRALRRTLPDVPVILASGRVDEGLALELQALGVAHRLDKPFTQEQLARALHAVLGG